MIEEINSFIQKGGFGGSTFFDAYSGSGSVANGITGFAKLYANDVSFYSCCLLHLKMVPVDETKINCIIRYH